MELNSCDVEGFVNSDEFNQCGIEEGIITQQLFGLLLEHTVHGLANLVQDLVAVVDLRNPQSGMKKLWNEDGLSHTRRDSIDYSEVRIYL